MSIVEMYLKNLDTTTFLILGMIYFGLAIVLITLNAIRCHLKAIREIFEEAVENDDDDDVPPLNPREAH